MSTYNICFHREIRKISLIFLTYSYDIILLTASLDDVGFNFIKRCLSAIEERGRFLLV